MNGSVPEQKNVLTQLSTHPAVRPWQSCGLVLLGNHAFIAKVWTPLLVFDQTDWAYGMITRFRSSDSSARDAANHAAFASDLAAWLAAPTSPTAQARVQLVPEFNIRASALPDLQTISDADQLDKAVEALLQTAMFKHEIILRYFDRPDSSSASDNLAPAQQATTLTAQIQNERKRFCLKGEELQWTLRIAGPDGKRPPLLWATSNIVAPLTYHGRYVTTTACRDESDLISRVAKSIVGV